MNPIIGQNGEIELLCNDPRFVAYDGLPSWQTEYLLNNPVDERDKAAEIALRKIDKITDQWIKSLRKEELNKIRRQKCLRGITIPKDWLKVWRFILKEPALRDSRSAVETSGLGTYVYFWNVWAEQCMNKYLDEMDKDLIALVDRGYIYSEIGQILLNKYGDKFWKKRKENAQTTPGQVVNNNLYVKLPMKITRGELTQIVLWHLQQEDNNE